MNLVRLIQLILGHCKVVCSKVEGSKIVPEKIHVTITCKINRGSYMSLHDLLNVLVEEK